MMRFSTLLKHPADWMTGAVEGSGVVLTSRVRLARNLQREPFPGWSTKERRVEVLKRVKPEVEALPEMKNGFSQELDGLTSLQKQVLVERHLISREQAARGEGSAAIVSRKQALSLMINEEDHLRMQSIRPGLALSEAYELVSSVDAQLESNLDFAFDHELGYLSACPTNLGTGMRASAMLHLPGLVLSDQIAQVLQAVGKLQLAVRGFFGEGTESLGNLFQISNQSTLGESEETIIRRLERVLEQVTSHERNARLKLFEDDADMVFDRVGRAYGTLRHAHVIASKEALNLLSLLRLGADLDFFPSETGGTCDSLLMEIQPAHLQLHSGKKLTPEKRDAIRAEIIRTRLQSLEPPAMKEQQAGEEWPPPSDTIVDS
ncbi:MAG: protein arginine kinase [Verrucomicrobiaceae bacterium]|nr:protein arginine kinase [Verrucomicrobiaceae bacterium]